MRSIDADGIAGPNHEGNALRTPFIAPRRPDTQSNHLGQVMCSTSRAGIMRFGREKSVPIPALRPHTTTPSYLGSRRADGSRARFSGSMQGAVPRRWKPATLLVSQKKEVEIDPRGSFVSETSTHPMHT